MSLREWLILIGALVIIGVIVDGLRRMRRARLDSWEISQGMGGGDIGHSPVDDDYNPELPGGGARVVNPGPRASRPVEEPAPQQHYRKPEPEPEPEPEPVRAVDEPPFQESPGAEDPVSNVSSGEAVADDDGIIGEARVHSSEPAQSASQPESWGRSEPAEDGLKAERDEWAEPESKSDEGEGGAFSARGLWQRIREGTVGGPEEQSPESASGESASNSDASPSGPEERPAAGANRPEAGEVIVINVLCRGEDERFDGTKLQKLLEACGMEYGDMGIYHRHEEPDTRTPVQFSVANAVSPGTFHPEEMEQMQTPGISFFLSLPGPSDSIQAFDFMMETAQAVVRNLGGELKDENRSVMTAQTIEHCRQRIREFERKQRFVRN